jgi:F0F1-type ATP synthase assembly protein I
MMEVMRAMNPYRDIGMTFVVAIGGGAWLGYWADQRWGTAPWLLFVGAVLGIAVGFYGRDHGVGHMVSMTPQ